MIRRVAVPKAVLLIISGPSGVGKGTICSELMRLRDDLFLSVSATTRRPRLGEAHGVNYFFMSHKDFISKCEEGEFLEWAEVYGNYYGTPKTAVDKALDEGKNVVLEIDIQGALQIKEKVPGAVLIFIAPPSYEELEKRLIKRDTDKQKIISRRLQNLNKEMNCIKDYDYVVVNDTVCKAARQVNCIIEAEKCRPHFYPVKKF